MTQPPSLSAYLPGLEEDTRPSYVVVIPKPFHAEALEISKEEPLPHPAWGKVKQRRDQLIVVTKELADVEELADFAHFEIEEPREQLTKSRRDAAKAMLARCHRLALLEPLGNHLVAVEWKAGKEGKAGHKQR